jgi:hypothetical protein
MKSSIISAVQELLRTAILAVIPVLVDGLNRGEIDWRLASVAGLIALLRGVEKFLYKEGVNTRLDLKRLDSLK